MGTLNGANVGENVNGGRVGGGLSIVDGECVVDLKLRMVLRCDAGDFVFLWRECFVFGRGRRIFEVQAAVSVGCRARHAFFSWTRKEVYLYCCLKK